MKQDHVGPSRLARELEHVVGLGAALDQGHDAGRDRFHHVFGLIGVVVPVIDVSDAALAVVPCVLRPPPNQT